MIELSQAILVLSYGLVMAVIVLNNITENDVTQTAHVMSMDDIPSTPLQGRAITKEWVHWLGYYLITATEAATSILCILGAGFLFFQGTNDVAIAGLTLAVLLFFLVFRGVAGQYFKMWASKNWNGLPDAFQMGAMAAIFLMYLLAGG